MTSLSRSKRSLAVGEYDRSSVFCDWLDVTCSPADSFIETLVDWFAVQGFSVTSFGDDKALTYRLGSGTLRLDKRFNFHRASASGTCIGELRKHGLFRDYVNILGSVGHKVTRLDAAVDVGVDAPIVLSRLEKAYNQGEFRFGRKGLRTTTIFKRRESDNALTGTWYAGHRTKARVTARVYDKQNERLERGIITPPLTRYELTFSKDYGCSLWDVLMPTSLFYSHASGSLLDAPASGFDAWDSRGLVPWVSEPVDTDLTLERFSKRVAYSPDLAHICALAARFGAQGEECVMRELAKQVRSMISESEQPESIQESA